MKQGSTNRKVNQQARRSSRPSFCSRSPTRACRWSPSRAARSATTAASATFFYTADRGEYEEVAEAFEKASGRIRSLMARQLSWRVAPALRFILDKSVDEAERIASALERDAERNRESAAIAAERARPSRQLKKSIRNSGGAPL